MLSREQNELLTKTGPATPMGNLLRRYWIPALLAEEVPEPDSPPAQVRLLGEELVAFRDSRGRIGLLDEHCAHLSFVHRFFKKDGGEPLYFQDAAPAYEVEETDFGVRMVAVRKTGPDQHYVRVSSFVMPAAGCVPSRDDGFEIHMYVPADDTHCWRYDLGFKRSGPVREEEKTDRRSEQIGPGYEKKRNLRNHYLQDREVQRAKNFTGIEGFLSHDACATETMGPIYDRSREHLGASDKAVTAVRKFLLSSVKSFQEGKEPPHIVRDPAENRFPRVGALPQVIPAGRHWRQYFQHLANET